MFAVIRWPKYQVSRKWMSCRSPGLVAPRTQCSFHWARSSSPSVKVFEMATKRKFAAENSGALVPVKKPKQNQLALQDQGGAIQSV